ncbi:MAG: hypothetical protein CXT72_03370 [Methanobacteriota archaeon]|nr:MAG: hypothetical protein CXT72_03370 [Euryarchaeota archaeon]HIE63641.1 hypothetical protein [Candidatus Poseidoniales archaeon]HIK99361.1 hypothetical protein [Candidatus Poseidoniales archaeon]
MHEVRDFESVANLLLPHRKIVHTSILVISLLMLPGLAASLTPIDIEAYDMESPELTADKVLNQEFASSEVSYGIMVTIRDPSNIDNSNIAPHLDDEGNVLFDELPTSLERIDYPGESTGLVGEGVPLGGILNLSVLREIDTKVARANMNPLAEFTRPIVSELTGKGAYGILALPDNFRAFMANESMLTRDTVNLFGQPIPAKTNWNDCGELECLQFDDPNLTQSHIDLVVHRMIMHSDGAMLRWMSTDRGFTYDESSPVIGPIGGKMNSEGTFANDIEWGPGRWSASTTWILVQLGRDSLEDNGFTYSWIDAASEPEGYSYYGSNLLTTPPLNTVDECRTAVESGEAPCSVEWALMAMEASIRSSDDLTISMLIGEGINVEVNRELQESLILMVMMVVAIIGLLWLSLRRFSDVAIVTATLGFSLLWMQGLIGWGIIGGDALGIKIISRSQFSNLLPILVLALGIDDSLHALHRYKEERRDGKSPEGAAHASLTRVGRAIMLTSFTTMAAFAANLTSDIAALRSFGIEAALGVGAAFVLTGLWGPIIRMDLDLFMKKRGKLVEEDSTKVHMVKEDWLANIATTASKYSTISLVLIFVSTAFAVPVMMSLEGDFKVEDFIAEESDFAQGIILVNTRFSDEGEPAAVIIEGDMLDPRVYAAIQATRVNMMNESENDPGKYTKTPLGTPEMHAIDELIWFAKGSMAIDSTPFENAGWNSESLDCSVEPTGLPDETDRDCLRFLYGFLFTYGVPAGGIIPEIPASISALYILPNCVLDQAAVHLCEGGELPEYQRMTMRWGISNAEQFSLVGLVLAELKIDMQPFQELAASDISERAKLDSTSEEFPVTWAIPTGDPVTRYIASSSMQKELQGSLLLGVLFCLIMLWWGFRPVSVEGAGRIAYSLRDLIISMPIIVAILFYVYFTVNSTFAAVLGLLLLYGAGRWSARSLSLAMFTTTPIVIVVIWLYAIIAMAGYGLNMVTVAIAAMSLGVGIDYVIHVVERYREERSEGASVDNSIRAIGGAAGLALVGSAVSDVTGFLIIGQSAMGFFASFGLFCAVMIGLSLFASMITTPAMLGALARWRISGARPQSKNTSSIVAIE